MAPKKILAIKLRSMGDTVLMIAPILEMTRSFPQAEIDIAVLDIWAPLFEGMPGIHRIWTIPHSLGRYSRLMELTRLALRLRKEKYDCVVNFHASPSTAKLSFATGAPCRSIHFHGHYDRDHFSTVEIPGKGTLKPVIERDMDTVRALGIHVPAGLTPQVYLRPSEEAEAQTLLDRFGIPKPILALNLGASRPTKSWPIERYGSLAIEWCRKEKGGVLAIAGPSEEPLIRTFLNSIDDLLLANFSDTHTRAQIRSRITATHGLSLRILAAVMSKVSVVAGNDSGPKHLAVAVNTPTVTLFGPEHPFEWHPYPKERHPYLFTESLPCRKDADPGMPAWCGIFECETEEHKCMRLIGVDSVFNECKRVAKRPTNQIT